MTLSPTDRIHGINIVLMLASCALAFLFPYGLLLFSYVVLGPAHYLTQISWLHDRKYFSAQSYTLPLFLMLTLAIIFSSGSISALFIVFAFLLGIPMILQTGHAVYALLIALCFGIAFSVVVFGKEIGVFMALLLPTVIHVFFFTLNFILAGTVKERSAAGYASLATMLACAASFFVLPSSVWPSVTHSESPGIAFFQHVANYLQNILNLSDDGNSILKLFSFLSFAYTYHYLNWFSKTRVIRWHLIPKTRLYFIVFLYIMALALYAYDFTLGFYVLLFLSVLHVLLEFPLNWRTFVLLTKSALHGLNPVK